MCDSHQEGGDGHANDKTCDDIRPVVAVFRHTVQTSEEGETHEPQRHDGLGQARPLGLDRAGHIHLPGETHDWVR